MADEKKVDKKPVDILDDVRNAEKRIKRAAFLKIIPKLKDMAREVNVLKKKAELMLDEVGIEEKDKKRIIDFINALPSVELSERDIKELREDMGEEVDEVKEKAEEQIEKSIEKLIIAGGAGGGMKNYDNYWSSTENSVNMVGVGGGSYLATAASLSSPNVVLSGSNGDLKVKI